MTRTISAITHCTQTVVQSKPSPGTNPKTSKAPSKVTNHAVNFAISPSFIISGTISLKEFLKIDYSEQLILNNRLGNKLKQG